VIRTDLALLEYFRKKPCERCGRNAPSEPHHILCRGAGGGGRLDVALNLVALCTTVPGYHLGCHYRAQHGGRAARDKCLEIVARREGLESGQQVLECLWRLQRLRAYCPRSTWSGGH